MSSDWILKEISKSIRKKQVAELAFEVKQQKYPVKELIDLTFYPVKEIAFRASWLLEHLEEIFPGYLEQEIDYFLTCYTRQENPSCQRIYSKIMMGFTRRENEFPSINFDKIVESTFEWLINPHTPVAVQVNCLDVLFNLRGRYHWIAEELRLYIPFLRESGSAAIQARSKKIVRKL